MTIEEETKLLIRKAHYLGYRRGYRDGFKDGRNEKGGVHMRQEILDRALLPRHRAAGLHLEEEEDFLHIKRNGVRLATFVSFTATYEIVHDACDRIIEREGHSCP